MKFNIVIAEDDGSGEVKLDLDSDDLGFNLNDMQEGESRSIVDKTGRSILITRGAAGFKFDVDGKTIEMPLFGAEHGNVWVNDGDGENVEVHVMRDAELVSNGSFDGVTILSSEPIDEVTREGIKSLLTSAGHTGAVEFIDTTEGGQGMHEIRVIKKEVVSEN